MSNSATLWTVALQALLSTGFPRQAYWSGSTFPPPGDLPDPGIEPSHPAPPALAGALFTTEPPRKPLLTSRKCTSKPQGHVTPPLSEWLSSKVHNVGRDVKKKVPSDNVGGNVNWCSHWGKQYRGLSKNYKQHHNMTQQFHSWVYTGKKKTTTLIQNDTCTPVSIAA